MGADMREKKSADNCSHLVGGETVSDSPIAITETHEAVKTDLPWCSKPLSSTVITVTSKRLKSVGIKYEMILLQVASITFTYFLF